MPNILITDTCNRSCSYCFAKNVLAIEKGEAQSIEMKQVRKLIEKLKTEGEKNFSIIGGEPSIHPQFLEIVQEVLDSGHDVYIFTNLLMDRKKAEFLSTVDTKRIGLLVNVNDFKSTPSKHRKTLEENLALLGQRASLSFNIFKPNFDLSYHADLIENHGIKRNIRLGLTQPVLGRSNRFLELSDYKEACTCVVKEAEKLNKRMIRVGFDCGFVPCMFSEEELGKLILCQATLDFICGPVLDIGINSDIWSCFPLSNWKKVKLEDFSTFKEVHEFYNSAQLMYKQSGMFQHCFDCLHIQTGRCSGGCAAHTINAFS